VEVVAWGRKLTEQEVANIISEMQTRRERAKQAEDEIKALGEGEGLAFTTDDVMATTWALRWICALQKGRQYEVFDRDGGVCVVRTH
jgi:hypothetical protein